MPDDLIAGEMSESRRTKIYDACIPRAVDILHIAHLEAEEAKLSDVAVASKKR